MGPGRGSSSFLLHALLARLRLPRPWFRAGQGLRAQRPQTSGWHMCVHGGWHPPACPGLVAPACCGGPPRGPLPSWAQAGVLDPSVVLGTSSFGPQHQSEGAGPTKRQTGFQTLEPRPASGADSCLFLGFARASLLPDSHGEQISQILRDRRFGACGGRWPEAWDGIPVAGPPCRGWVLGSDPERPRGPAVPPLPAVLQRRAGRGALQARGRVLPVSPVAHGGQATHPDPGPQHRLGVLLSLLLGSSWVSRSLRRGWRQR